MGHRGKRHLGNRGCSVKLYVAVKFRTPDGTPLWRHFTRKVGANRRTMNTAQRGRIVSRLMEEYGLSIRVLEMHESETPHLVDA